MTSFFLTRILYLVLYAFSASPVTFKFIHLLLYLDMYVALEQISLLMFHVRNYCFDTFLCVPG